MDDTMHSSPPKLPAYHIRGAQPTTYAHFCNILSATLGMSAAGRPCHTKAVYAP